MVSERTAISCPPGIRGLTGAPGDQYYERGDPVNPDYTQATLTLDLTWVDLDLSAIVGAGAKLLHLWVLTKHATPGSFICFRKKGFVNGQALSGPYTQGANIFRRDDVFCRCNGTGTIQYKGSADFTTVNVTVAGWWA